ncbi:MAG: sodium:proton exchanger [Thermoleophilia bacterium]|nr:sodium:proton exchanger [Thermoleophilia bacterium]
MVQRIAQRLGVPAPALFLALGVLVNLAFGSLGSAADSMVPFDAVIAIGSVALVLILFEGGFSGGFSRMRPSLGAIASVGIVGTFITTGLLAVAGHFVLGLDWDVAALVAVALAPTDPAAVFSVLGSSDVRGRAGVIIEGESGINDPVGIALMAGMLELVDGSGSVGTIAADFLLELVIGIAVGAVAGLVFARVLDVVTRRHAWLAAGGAILAAFAAMAVALVLHGSGFLAVLVAGLVLGDRLRSHDAVERVVAFGAASAEVVMFTLLGLTITLASIGDQLLLGLAAFVILTLAIRPVVVAVTLAGADLTRAERTFIAWGGLKGAVPILLAAIAYVADPPEADLIYGVTFVAVAASVLVQGATIPLLIRRLGLVTEPLP